MATPWKRIDHVHLADQVYEALRERILNRLIQTNEQINIEAIAEELGVSRTPVVEALNRLAGEGLVEVKPRRGTYVRSITEQDLREIFQLREALELYAIRRLIESPDRLARAQELRQWFDRMSPLAGTGKEFVDHAAFSEADKEFHRTLIRACDNSRMLDAYDKLNHYMHIMRGNRYKQLVPPVAVQNEHQLICEAVEQGDVAKAEQIIKDHLASVHKRMLENIQSNGGEL